MYLRLSRYFTIVGFLRALFPVLIFSIVRVFGILPGEVTSILFENKKFCILLLVGILLWSRSKMVSCSRKESRRKRDQVQGMPFYSEVIRYSKKVEAEAGKEFKITLNDWNGTVAWDFVDGEKVGIIEWPLYDHNLTTYLEEGNL
jgi:hypothetical protein